MEKKPIEMQASPKTRRALQVVGKLSPNEEVRIGVRGKIWLGVSAIAIVGCCVIGLVISKRQTSAIERPSPEQERIAALTRQISSLTQTDLIVFPDGRVWYVRAVRGNNVEVVGWIGDYTRSANIDSFVLSEDHVTIVVTMNQPGRSKEIGSLTNSHFQWSAR